MPRRPRSSLSAPFFHVINRTARRVPIFLRPLDYRAFLDILAAGLARHPVKLMSYCVMANHWHLVVGPDGPEALSRFMQWVTATHASRWLRRHNSLGQGALYQGRFRSLPVSTPDELVRVCRYVERNALAARLVRQAQDWPWGSLAARLRSDDRVPLTPAPFLASSAWVVHVNLPPTPTDLVTDVLLERGVWEDTNPTSVPKTAKTVENSPVPLDDAAHDPRTGKGAQERIGVRGGADEDQPHAHVERAKHLLRAHTTRLLQPREERRHRPALAVK